MTKEKKTRTIAVAILAVVMVCSCICAAFSDGFGGNTANALSITKEESEKSYVDSLRYGYNVTAGKPICSPGALRISAPILKPFNEGLYKFVAKEEKTVTNSGSSSASSARGIAEEMSTTLSGGINAKVGIVQADIDGTFNTTSSLTKTYDEYYAIYYQRMVRQTYVIEKSVDLRDYLTDTFKSDMNKIKTESDALVFLQEYGTHLFTGFDWGGLMQVSNYQKTQSSSDRISNSLDLKGKMDMALKSYGGSTSFNFSSAYAESENTQNKVSNYSCALYGGDSPSAITLDQLFTYNASYVDGKGNYMYDRWVTSINNSEKLAILGKAEAAKYIPVWDLLPDGVEYLSAKRYLRNAYATLCGDKYDEFLKEYPSTSREIGESGVETGVGTIDGYTLTYAGNTSYNQISESTIECSVYRGSTISMNCTTDTIPAGMKKWKVKGNPDWVEIVDAVSGIFNVKESAPVGRAFSLQLYSGDTLVKDLGEIFVVKSASFSGGDGTYENPYILSTKEDLLNLSSYSDLWGKSYRLSTNIDLESENWSPVGVSDNLFSGTFDGNHCTISNVKITEVRDKAIGLFGYIDKSATIKDLFVNNVNIGYEDKQMLKSEVSYAGGLVGNSKGTVENCLVDGLYINARCVISNSQNNLSVGGLVGTASGAIQQCGVRNSTLISGYLMDELIDPNNVKGSLNNLKKNKKIAVVHVGGLVGETSSCKISNCYVNIVDNLYSQAATYTTTVDVGGLCGYVGLSTHVETSVVGKITKFLSAAANWKTKNQGKATFAGEVDTTNADKASSFTKCYAQKVDGIETGVKDGCTAKSEITQATANDLSGDIWCAEQGTKFPILIKQEIGMLSRDISKAKTEFYYGESFDIAGVSVSGTYRSSGEEIQLDVFSYDSSAYNPMQEGTYKIKIYAMGRETAYEVTVRKIKVVNIKVEAVDPSKTYYVDETIDVNDYKVSYVLEDGLLRDTNAEKLSYVQYPTDKIAADNTHYTYALGDNEIIFKCGSMSASTVVEGIEKVVSSIRISKNPKKMSYIAGETFKCEAMEVIADYTDGTSGIVNNKELEIIGERISEGENEVIISYGAYKTASVVVQGEPAPSETYIVKFVDYDGSLISEKTYTSGSSVNVPSNPTRSSDNTYKYTFSGWSPNVATTCTANATYTAQYTQTYIEYTIVFVGEDGREIARNTYHYGDTVTAPELPDKTIGGVKYVGSWDSDFVAVCNGNKTYTAKYTKSGSDVGDGEYTIVFKYDDGTIIETQHHNFGEDVVAPTNVTKASDNVYSYKFVGWDKTVKNVCIANAEYIAVFEKVYIEYTVKFVNYDGTVISTETYHYGDKLVLPKDAPTRESANNTEYKFVGWGTTSDLVVENVTYTAQYAESPIAEKGVITIPIWLFVTMLVALVGVTGWAFAVTFRRKSH